MFVSKVQSFKLYNFEIVTVTLPISLTAAATLKNRWVGSSEVSCQLQCIVHLIKFKSQHFRLRFLKRRMKYHHLMAIGDFFQILQNMHAYIQLMVKLYSVKSVSRLKNFSKTQNLDSSNLVSMKWHLNQTHNTKAQMKLECNYEIIEFPK